jgi:hypothetical protein
MLTLRDSEVANVARACDVETAAGDLSEELSIEEGRRLLDEAARKHLNMSGEEFIESWDAGLFGDRADTLQVMQVAGLLPLAR